MSEPTDVSSNTRLLVPRQSLASCLRACISRSTVEQPLLDPAQRLNRFPASPFCALIWIIEGESEIIEPAEHAQQVRHRVIFRGPTTRPMVTYNPGPVRLFFTLFFPQALHDLTGLDLSTWVDKWAPAEQVFGAEWAAALEPVLHVMDDTARMQVLQDFLEPQWQANRPDEFGAAAADWLRRLSVQAASSGWGGGVRNVERRIKAWAGQPMRTLRRMRRAEQFFLESREKLMSGDAAWARMALDNGYADQAHLCREARQITGVSPTELARAGREDESYWVYRVWA
ncbi:MAG TPA: AraC family transcriptional regulator [Burkholderiaceae bacterium]